MFLDVVFILLGEDFCLMVVVIGCFLIFGYIMLVVCDVVNCDDKLLLEMVVLLLFDFVRDIFEFFSFLSMVIGCVLWIFLICFSLFIIFLIFVIGMFFLIMSLMIFLY